MNMNKLCQPKWTFTPFSKSFSSKESSRLGTVIATLRGHSGSTYSSPRASPSPSRPPSRPPSRFSKHFSKLRLVPAERELRSELHYSGVSRRGLFSKVIRLGLYTCILYVCIYIYIYIYIYGFLVCQYARSLVLSLILAARQNTPAIDGAIYRPNGTSYQLQPSFHLHSTEPEPIVMKYTRNH